MSFSTFNTFQSINKNKNQIPNDPTLLSWYKFKSGDIDATNLVYNYAINSYDAVFISNVPTPSFSTTTKKIYSSSLYLDIANLSYIKLPPVDLTVNNAYTLSFWICQTNPTNKSDIALICYGETNNWTNTVLYVATNYGSYYYNIGQYNNNHAAYSNDSLWHHYVIIFGKTTAVTVYIDNILSSSLNGTLTPYTSVKSIYNYIGHIGWQNSNINAHISDYRLYNKKLSTTEITALYNLT